MKKFNNILNNKKILVFIPLFIFVVLGFIQISNRYLNSNSEPIYEEKALIKVGFSQIESDNPWRTAQINSFKEAFSHTQIEFVYHEPEEYTSYWQANDILSLINTDVNYLVIVPSDISKLIPALQKAKEKNIPVFLISQDTSLIDSSLYESVIMADYKKEGQLCAQMLKQKYENESCNIIEISGPENSPAAEARSKGFHNEICKYPNFKIIDIEYGNFNRLTAQKAMENALIKASQNNLTINAIFAHSDEDGLGALQAIKVAGIDPHTLSIVSINGIQDVCKAFIANEYLGTVESNPKWGQIVLNLIKQIQNGDKPFPIVFIPCKTINSDNVNNYFNYAY